MNKENNAEKDALELESSMTPVPEDESLEENKNKDTDESENASTQALSTKGYIEQMREQREKYLMKGKKLEIAKKIVKSLLKFSGNVEGLKIWIPLDSKDEYSRTMCFSLWVEINFDQVNTLEHQLNKYTQTLIKILPLNDNQDAKVQVNNLILYMLNRHLLLIDQTLKNEKLIFPSKIHMLYNKELKAQENTDNTNIDVVIDPLNSQVGFRELENFRRFQIIMDKITRDLAKALNPLTSNSLEKNMNMDEEKLHQIQKPNSHNLEKPIEEKKKPVSDVPRMKDRKSKEYVNMKVNAKLESLSFRLMGKNIARFVLMII